MGKDLERTVILVKEKRNQLQTTKENNNPEEGRTHELAINTIQSFLRALQQEPRKWAALLSRSWRWAWQTGDRNRGRGTEDTSDSLQVTNCVHVNESDARNNVTNLETGKI